MLSNIKADIYQESYHGAFFIDQKFCASDRNIFYHFK